MTIYTKKGDGGKTGIYSTDNNQAKRLDKDSLRINAIGTIDELNSYLGVVIAQIESPVFSEFLKDIQRDLFTIGSILAGSDLSFYKTKTKKIEREIDSLEEQLPVLKNFILPGGTNHASHLQYARSLTRRAEREVVAYSKANKVKPEILKYLNRISDLMFMLARLANHQSEVIEEVWVGKKK